MKTNINHNNLWNDNYCKCYIGYLRLYGYNSYFRNCIEFISIYFFIFQWEDARRAGEKVKDLNKKVKLIHMGVQNMDFSDNTSL